MKTKGRYALYLLVICPLMLLLLVSCGEGKEILAETATETRGEKIAGYTVFFLGTGKETSLAMET